MHSEHDTEGLTPTRLRAVRAVATSGSFSAAALEVGTSQSQVSRAVATVEAILGTTLFDRSTRTVRLTDTGREFVERVALIQAELDAAVRAARPERPPTPHITIASLTSVSELHVAKAVSALGRSIVRMRCIEGLHGTVEHAVMSGQAMAGISDLADVAVGLVAQPLWREPFRLAVPSGHRLSRRRTVRLDDLTSEPLIGFSRDAELRTTLDRELAAARQLRRPDFVVDRYRTALSLVAAGLGVMIVPSIASAARPPGTRLVDLDHPELSRVMGVLRRPDTVLPELLTALIDELVAVVASLPNVTPV